MAALRAISSLLLRRLRGGRCSRGTCEPDELRRRSCSGTRRAVNLGRSPAFGKTTPSWSDTGPDSDEAGPTFGGINPMLVDLGHALDEVRPKFAERSSNLAVFCPEFAEFGRTQLNFGRFRCNSCRSLRNFGRSRPKLWKPLGFVRFRFVRSGPNPERRPLRAVAARIDEHRKRTTGANSHSYKSAPTFPIVPEQYMHFSNMSSLVQRCGEAD